MAQTLALILLLLALLMPLTATAATVYRRDNNLCLCSQNDADTAFWSEELEAAPAVERPQRDANNDFFAFGSIFETLLDILSTLRDATMGHVLEVLPPVTSPSSSFDDDARDAVRDAVPDAAPEANEILAPASDVAAAAAAKAEFYKEQAMKRVKKQHSSPNSSVFNDVRAMEDHIKFDSRDNSIIF